MFKILFLSNCNHFCEKSKLDMIQGEILVIENHIEVEMCRSLNGPVLPSVPRKEWSGVD